MNRKHFILIITMLLGCNMSFSQKRPSVPWTVPKAEKKALTNKKTKNAKVSSTTFKSKVNSSKQNYKRISNQAYFKITPKSVSFGPNGGTKTFQVISSTAWHISTGTGIWGQLKKNGNKLTLNVEPNYSTSSRIDYFEITSGSKTIRVNITQSVKPYLLVSSQEINFPSSGGSKLITINSSKEWSISMNTYYSWAHLTRDGNQICVYVDKNTIPNHRTDYFTIKSGDTEKRIKILQHGTNVSAYIKEVWVERNAYDSYGNKGMMIHVNFDVKGMLNQAGQVAVYFYGSDGSPLKDKNGVYCTSEGDVATHVDFTPDYENCSFKDLSIFMPYDELHTKRIKSCYFNILLWNGDSEIARRDKNYFK